MNRELHSAGGDAREAPSGPEPDAPTPREDQTRADTRGVSAAMTAAQLDENAFLPNTRIARYTVLEIIGSGGVGIVYSAYDPDLDRKVALKLLRPSKLAANPGAVENRRARLMREAQALAKLSHPNVVPIYEVGTFAGQIYLVMEFVEGTNLGGWLKAERRSWSEIVALFVQAGRGLAAAHAAGIVHRDFKPENVRVGTDGRVRVLDFGLAAVERELEPGASGSMTIGERVETPPEGIGSGSGDGDPSASSSGRASLPASASSSGALVDSLVASARSQRSKVTQPEAVTREGQVMGTPAYMAPEQAAGGLVDARSDQFSFCVAMYEALYGVRPFRGRFDDVRRYRNLSRLRRLPGERPADLPGELERALLRGLSVDSAERFEDMDELLRALAGVGRESQRLWWVPVLLVVLAGAAIFAFLDREPPAVCDDGSPLLSGVWDPAVADEFEQRILATKQPSAAATWSTISAALDGWSQAWRRERLGACEATHVEGRQSPAMLEQRLACLDRQLVQLEGLLTGLRRRADTPAVFFEQLSELPTHLPNPDRCGAAQLHEGDSLLPREGPQAEQVRTIRERLAELRGLRDAGDHEAAIEGGEEVLAEAEELGLEALTAEALLELGRSVDAEGSEGERAGELLEQAALAAQRSGNDGALVAAAGALVRNLADGQGRLEIAEPWSAIGRATLERHGDDPELEAELRRALGEYAMTAGDYEAALDEHERVYELVRDRLGEDHPSSLRALRATGDVLRELGRFNEAGEALSRAYELTVATFGAKHPDVAATLDALANVRAQQGDYDEALSLHEQSLRLSEELVGAEHRDVARTLNNIAIIYDETGRYAEAVDILERARTILVANLGEAHPDVAFVDVNLGSALRNLGRYDEAIERFEAARDALSEALGPEHMAVGVALQNLGSARIEKEDYEAALADLAEAHEILVKAFGLEHPAVAAIDHNRGEALRGIGRLEEAQVADQRALELRERLFHRQHTKLVEVLSSLSETELALGHHEEALTRARRAEELLSEASAPAEVARAKLALAAALAAQAEAEAADLAEARELARGALRDLEGIEGAGRQRDKLRAWLATQGVEVEVGADGM